MKKEKGNTNKILPVSKPVGLSTYDVIRLFKKQTSFKGKIGHAGTLDPFATGVVLLLLGGATKKFEEIKTWHKVYLAGLRLGAVSQTGDVEGKITVRDIKKRPTLTEIKKALQKFKGEIEQKVPLYSAAKHKGRPLYKIAREDREEGGRPVAGEEVRDKGPSSAGQGAERKKKVSIYSLELVYYRWPFLTLRAGVSGGTYIRQLAEDIGSELKTGAFLYFLQRERVGNFDLKNCLNLSGPDRLKSELAD